VRLPRDPSLIAAVLLGVVAFAGVALKPVTDADVWWHLRAGADLLAGRPGAFVESWSFTAAGRPWINHEWLAELVFALVQSMAGGAGVVAFTALVMAVVALLLARTAAIERLPAPLIAFGVALGALAAGSRFVPRPQIVTYLCLALLLERLASERVRRAGELRDPAYANAAPLRPMFLLALFLIQVVWTNAHGPVPGLAIGSLLVLGGALPGLALARRGLVMATLAVASVAHPQGWQPLLEYVPHLLEGGLYQSTIREWLPLTHPEQAGLAEAPATWLMAGLAAATALFGLLHPAGRRQWGYGVLLVGLAVAPFSSVRHRDLLAIALVPAVAALIGAAVRGRRPFALPLPIAILVSAAALFLAVIPGLGLFRYPAAWPPRPGISEAAFPAAAVDFIEAGRIGSRIFNAYDYGGYLAHRLPASHRIFIDGRYFVYGEPLYEEYLEIRDGNPRARERLGAHGADLLVVRYPEAGGYGGLATQARTWRDWALVFFDDATLVYAARSQLEPEWVARNAFDRLDPTLPGAMNEPDYWRLHYRALVGEARRAARLAPRAVRPLLVQALAFEYNGRDGDAAAAYEAILVGNPANRPAREGMTRLRSRNPDGLPPAYTEAELNAFDGFR
jgi:hypothetical protein